MGIKVREKQKGSGEFWVFIHHKGLRSSKCVGSKAAAEKVAEIIQARITLGEFGLDDVQAEEAPTLVEYAAIWLASSVEGVLDDGTHERYSEVFTRDILPALGKKALGSISVGDVDDLMDKLVREGRTAKAISLVRTVLSSCMRRAARKGLVSPNPMAGYRHTASQSSTVQARRPKDHEVNPFTEEETHTFLSFSMQESPGVYGPMFLCNLRTGVRLGELVALHWEDVQWGKGLLHVRRMFKRGKVKGPKNGKPRLVDISDQLLKALRALREQQEREAARKGEEVPDIIFHHRGHYRAQNTVRKAFKTMLKRAGLREIRVHDMRHTYASHLISRGISLAYIKEQMGHSSIKITVDIYGHLVPGSNRAAVNCLDRPMVSVPEGAIPAAPNQPR